ncbi:M16 family metallopeptidase [Pedobacter nutrimenti]|uniref:Putative Zn-dependent peptidase n=1 Tax=Pedobacter nutrimenti TaxID=1241337 RepID=A0A318ULV0_9SPHI|nr:pitrilysin family protein [Pedobacter nutrimenti]PYF76058.1 putative Zn-dependent peptidase [Pedobacter nutrimenti]
MKKIFIFAIAALALQPVFAQKLDRSQKPKPGPAPTITFADPAIYKLPNGITVLVVENHRLPKVSASYTIDAGPITEGSKAGKIQLMGGMLNEGTTSKTKVQFDQAVDQLGANVSLSASGGSTSALTRYFDSAFLLMAEALRNPSFPQASFDKLKSQYLTGLKSTDRSAKAISGRVVNALSYGSAHPLGEFQTEQSINSITLDDVKAAYKQYITPSRAYLTFVGDIKPEAAKALAIKAFGDWKGNTLNLPVLAKVNNPAKTEVDVIDVPNAVQSEITVTNLIDLPLSSPDYHAVLLANEILGGGADAKLFRNLREKHGFTYGAYSSTGSGRFQSQFKATAAVRNEKVDSAVVEFLKEINVMRTEKVSAEVLQSAKNLYNGSFALGLENPGRMAGFASSILINNLPKDFYRTYLQKLNAVTAEDILRVSKKYYNHEDTRIIIVGKQEQFVAGLKKLGFTVKSFDKFAAPVTAAATATAAVNKSAAEIISKYLTAIGGEAELKKVNSIVQNGEFEIQGQKLAAVFKQLSPNLESNEISMGGNVVMKQAYNGTSGFQSQMGQKKEFSAEELAEKKDKKALFDQLFYGQNKVEVAGTAKVGQADAYKLNVTFASGLKQTEYYDVNTGYLLKDEKTRKANGVDITQSTEYSDYRKVGNVFFPFKMVQSVQMPQGSQEFSITIKDIQVNTGLKAADFN